MKLSWKIVVPVACVGLICAAAYLLWKRADKRRADAAFAACRVKAEQGDAKSQYELGRMYFSGRGVPKDLNAWAEWCRKAAVQGYARPETQLGNTYYYGWGVDRDFDQALRWYHKAADQGEPEAEKDIGSAYFYGNGVAKDYAQAAHWYRLSADKGYAAGEYDLGYMYSYGLGVARDPAEARKWYSKAAGHGDAEAQIILGLREPRFNDLGKFIVGVELTGALLLLFGGLGTLLKAKPRRSNLAFVAGLLGLFYSAIDVYSHSSLAVFRSPVSLDLLAVDRGLFAAFFVATALGIVLSKRQWRRAVRFFFGLVCAVFLVINVYLGVVAVSRGIPAGSAANLVRHVCSLDAFLSGWAVALVVSLRWKKGKSDDVEPIDRGESEEAGGAP